MATPTDPLYAQQWHLPMLGNINRIWDQYTGAGVTVAVYDDGLDYTHPDLAANYNAAEHFRFNGVTYDPTPQGATDAHGTACAGLIAAVDNNGRGGTGVAHGATLTGFNYINDLQNAYDWDTQTTSALYNAAMRWAARFDIMSNSWGANPVYADELNLNSAGNSSAVDAGHFAWVSANGRGGLGTIVVKAAGNETSNANGDGLNASRHTITVAATEQTGFAANYSNFGSSILVAAPAAAVTTDLSGPQGYSAGDYTTTFNGTSAATPVVAGVVALMLEANDGLGWRDVQSILAASASHTGTAVGGGSSATEVGTWQSMGGNQWNGGGAMYHLSYGFGMVDAYAAVRMAEVWTRLNGAADTSANEITMRKVYNGADVAIRDSDGTNGTAEAQIAISVAQDIEIDSVHVTLDITHSYAADLVIFLRTPTGQMINLFNQEGEDYLFDGGLEWTFAVEAVRGMSSQGTWRLMFHDRATGDTGVVTDAQLEFFGSTNSANDVFNFTDDFAMLRNQDADRRVIDDVNGGFDTLNFAAMSGAVAINMGSGGAIRVNGTTLATLASGTPDFERLQTGDGADRLVGNYLANVIFAGRGNDRIHGGGRNDKLFGEAGNDVLIGAGGNDTLNGGGGSDVFVFGRGFGQDRITGWVNDQDTLRVDDAIWGGGMSVGQVLSTFGSVVAGSVVLDFGASMVLTLQGFNSLASLTDDVTIF